MKTRPYLWPAVAFAVALLPLIAPLPPTPNPALVVASAAWTATLLWLVRHQPEWALVATAPVHYVNNTWAIVATAFVVFTACRTIQHRPRTWTLVALTAALQLAFGYLQSAPENATPAEEAIGAAGATLFLLIFPAISGMLLGRRKPMVRLLKERNEYLERARALTATSARSEERAHIAGEMHDMLGHRLSLISIHAGALELATATKAPQLQEQAELIRTTSTIAMTELRQILGVLRTTPEPDSLDEDTGTRTDIDNLVEASRHAGLTVQLDWSGDDLHDADPRTRRAVHRVVREALTNVHKHAPEARTRVLVDVQNSRVQLQVINGPTDAEQGKGTRRGLIGLEERVGLLGGAFSAGPPREGGFRVVADIPLHPAAQPEQSPADVQEVPPPLAAEVLTMPRVIGSGCLGLLTMVPVLVALIALILVALFSTAQMEAREYEALRVGVTTQDEVFDAHGFGRVGTGGCSMYRATHATTVYYELCFRDNRLVSKREEVQP